MKWMKRGILILGILVLFLVSAMIAVVIFVDPNDYKDRITESVAESTGRNLHIDGEINLSVFPWLGLELNKVSLDNPPAFSKKRFAEIERLNVKVALLPLFTLKVRVGEIQLVGLNVNLERKANGVNNWDDLATPKSDKLPAPDSTDASAGDSSIPLNELYIGGIDIQDANISWLDAQNKTSTWIEYLQLETGAIRQGKPLNFETTFALRNENPKVIAGIELSGEAILDLAAEHYSVDDVTLNIKASGKPVPGNDQEIAIQIDGVNTNLKQQSLSVESLALSLAGVETKMTLNAENILNDKLLAQGDLQIDIASIRTLLSRLKQPAPITADNETLSTFTLKSTFKAGMDSLELNGLLLKIDDTNISGKLSAHNFSAPKYNYALNLDQIDLDRYLPPADDAVPMPSDKGTSAAENAEIPLPVDSLRELDAKGDFKIDALQLMNLKLSAIDTRLNAKNGIVALSPLKLNLYDGHYNGNLTLDVTGKIPAYKMQFKLAGVQAGPLMQDFMDMRKIDGNLELDSNITTRGTTIDQLTRRLGGNLSFALNDGAFNGLNLVEWVRKAKAFTKRTKYIQQDSRNQTDIGTLTGTATIKNGIVNNQDLKLETKPHLFADGQGNLDLTSETIRYLLEINYYKNARVKEPDYAAITIKGKFNDPSIGIDTQRILDRELEEEKAKLKKEAEVKLAKEKATLKKKEQEAKNKVKEKLDDKVKGLLDKLF